jgi:hypothetical protein
LWNNKLILIKYKIFSKILKFSSKKFGFGILFYFIEFFNNFENVIISVEATKVLQYKVRNPIGALVGFSCLVKGSQQALGCPSPGARIQEEPQ